MKKPDNLPHLLVPATVVKEMIAHAQLEEPIECCGLLSGVGNTVHSIHPLTNEASSQTEFLALTGLIEPFKEMRKRSEELLAIYHSHPASEAVPSRTDLQRNYYPDTVHFIISLADTEPVARAFLLERDSFTEISWQTVAG